MGWAPIRAARSRLDVINYTQGSLCQNNRLNIYMVIPSYAPLVGGAERQLAGMINPLLKQNMMLTIITRRLPNVPDEEIKEGLRIVRLSARSYPVFFLLYLAKTIWSERKSIDVLHIHTLSSPAIMALLMSWMIGRPALVKVTRSGKNTQLSRYLGSFIGRRFFSLIKFFSHKIVSLTSDAKTELLEAGVDHEKIVFIPNGVEIRARAPAGSSKSINISFVGRLIERKRPSLLLDAVASLNIAEAVGAEVHFLGDGPERSNLERSARNLRCSVTFHGSTPHSKVISHLSSSDIFVLPSYGEGMSNALLEAMSLGLACVVTDIPANRDLIRHYETGFLFKSTDDLREIVQLLLSDQDLISAVGEAAQQEIIKKYSFEKVSKQYASLYRSILTGKNV